MAHGLQKRLHDMENAHIFEGKSFQPVLLVVSPDPGTRRSVRAWMELEGWNVLECASARTLPAGEAHVVLLDAMGEGTGDALQHRGSSFRGAPVIVLAADEQPAERWLRAGAYDVVSRPLDRPRLSLALTRGFELRRLSMRLGELEGALAAQRSPAPFSAANSQEVIPLAELERRAIRHALLVTRGNVSEAARLLGVGRSTLYRHLSPEQVAEARPQAAPARVAAFAALR